MQQKIRSQLMELLIENQSNFCSGEEISKRLGCSRAAIWKHIQSLKRKGYIIESRSGLGYRLLDRPDLIEPEELMVYLKTCLFGREIRYFRTIPTTQLIAHQWAREGAREGSLVVAEEQTAGKGRLGNRWFSPSHQGIWSSLILRPPISINEASHMTLLTSLAVYQAIWDYTQLPVEIKWPNDLLIRGKKICGILTELKGEQDQVDYLVVGVGINVNLTSDLEIERPFTSLSKEWGKPIRRAALLAKILGEWEQWYQLYLRHGFQPIKQQWEQITQFTGKRVRARTPNGKVIGVAKGINHQGALMLKTETGLVEIYSADIEY